MMLLDPDQVVEEIRPHLTTLPACIAGSVVASGTYGLPVTSDADIDVFCYTEQALISCIQKLVDHHFQIDERNERVWQRWLRYGLSGWHTNSLKLRSPSDSEVNLVYKTVGRVPMNSLASVLESFDFGLLGRGYDLYTQEWRDMRTFLFPDYDIEGPLPLMPSKRDGWRSGFISQYNGLREAGRYAKYHSRGFDLTLVKDDLVTGYYEIAVPDWKTLPRAMRDQWIASAQEAIEAVGPQRLTRWAEYQEGFNSSKVIAFIAPDAPWGVTR